MRVTKTAVLSAALFGLALSSPAIRPALAADDQPRQPVISVSGEGQAFAAPDMAIVSLTVLRQAETARAALDANTAAMSAVLAALKADGLADRDLQTSGFGIVPQYNYPVDKDGRTLPPELTGYQATNTLTVRLRALDTLGALLDRAVTLGVNQGGDIRFANDKPEPLITQARQAAMADAIAKARVLTEAAGIKLGRILEISETFPRQPPQPLERAMVAKDMAAGAPVPIASGENSYAVTVNVTFALDQ